VEYETIVKFLKEGRDPSAEEMTAIIDRRKALQDEILAAQA
jgi:hypothetical protein